MKRHLLFLAAMLSSWCVFAQPAPMLRNDWTTNSNPQVNRGANVSIVTNAGNKLTISATNSGGIDQTNRAGAFIQITTNNAHDFTFAATGLVSQATFTNATNGFIRKLDDSGTNLTLNGDGAVALSIAGAPDVLALDVIGGNGTMALPTGGGISLIGGNGGDNFSGLGGFLLFQSGNGGLGAIAVDMTSPGGIGGVGGAFSFNSGQGGDGGEAVGDQVAGDGGVGAAFAITSGNGGAGGGGSAANPGGVGGNAGGITIMGGNAGLGGADGGGGAGANGTAGTITINGGQGGGSNATIFLQTFGGASLNIGGVNYKFPTAQGAAGTFLTNNGSGVLTWATLGSSADATKIAIIGGGGTNNTFTNALFTNSIATTRPLTIMGLGGGSNDLFQAGAGGTNYVRINSLGRLMDQAFGGSAGGGAARMGPWVVDTGQFAIQFSGAAMGSAQPYIAGAQSVDMVFEVTAGQGFQFGNNSIFGNLLKISAAGELLVTNAVFRNTMTASNAVITPRLTNSVAITNQSPHTWTNFAVAAANGITTNDGRRSVLQGQFKWTLSLVGDSAQIVFAITNGASVRLLTNGVSTAVGAATGEVPIYIRLGPTNTLEIKTNVVGSGTATLVNMTMEPE